MNSAKKLKASSDILKKAKTFGAALAGFSSIEHLKKAPSFTFAPQMRNAGEEIDTGKNNPKLKPGEVTWPANARSMMVIAVEHPDDKPELDWWHGRHDPPGNRLLSEVVTKLCAWISETYAIGTVHLPYHVEKGGTYLKDAAVLAGLGCIGKNNLLLTPEYGARIRLRAFTLSEDFPPTGPISFNPCATCKTFCRKACPKNAFENAVHHPAAYSQERLPGRDGSYHLPACNLQMEIDEESAKKEKTIRFDSPVKIIKYCRKCEQACPVGRN